MLFFYEIENSAKPKFLLISCRVISKTFSVKDVKK